MKKLFIAALICFGAFTESSAQSLTIINNTATGLGLVVGASNGSCTSGCCSQMTSSPIQVKASSSIRFASINDLCNKGNAWLGTPCPTTLTVPGSHWDMAKVMVACGPALVGSGCDPKIKTTATSCTGGAVTWTTGIGGDVTVTIN